VNLNHSTLTGNKPTIGCERRPHKHTKKKPPPTHNDQALRRSLAAYIDNFPPDKTSKNKKEVSVSGIPGKRRARRTIGYLLKEEMQTRIKKRETAERPSRGKARKNRRGDPRDFPPRTDWREKEKESRCTAGGRPAVRHGRGRS